MGANLEKSMSGFLITKGKMKRLLNFACQVCWIDLLPHRPSLRKCQLDPLVQHVEKGLVCSGDVKWILTCSWKMNTNYFLLFLSFPCIQSHLYFFTFFDLLTQTKTFNFQNMSVKKIIPEKFVNFLFECWRPAKVLVMLLHFLFFFLFTIYRQNTFLPLLVNSLHRRNYLLNRFSRNLGEKEFYGIVKPVVLRIRRMSATRKQSWMLDK